MFSKRLPYLQEENKLYQLLQKKRSADSVVVDLTSSNPSEEELIAEAGLLDHFSNDKQSLYYKPSARGLIEAREAISEYYNTSYNIQIDPDDIFLTTGTSESYSYLFKLLANPGEEVLIPSPVYPLFEFIGQLEGITISKYRLYFGGKQWQYELPGKLDLNNIRAMVIINPNNPTGSYIKSDEKLQLSTLSKRENIPLIIDEVFYDYELEVGDKETFVSEKAGLNFVLNGVSKLCGLPQMKLGWIILAGEEKHKAEAKRRLEIITDTFLSVSTPIMRAAYRFLEEGNFIREKIQNRIKHNYQHLKSYLKSPYRLLPVEGGWYAIIELDENIPDEDFALQLLKEKNVYVYPGYFFEFEESNKIVISLIVKEERFQEGVSLIMDFYNFR
ncbi:MAG: pyridoxal phosphate-dependent aminotransferase [Ignavibacteria bacterium]